MKLKIKQGTTSKLIRIFAQDSAATDGSGKTGIAYNASGLTAYYLREGDSAATAITLYSGTVGTYSSGCWSEVDSTNMPGVYELGLPDAAINATSDGSVVVMIKGASDMAPVLVEIELDAVDYRNATDFGLSNLDAAISDVKTKTDQLTFTLANKVDSNALSGNFMTDSMTTTNFGIIQTLVGSVGNDVLALNDFDPASDTVANVTLVATCTTNSDMRGTDGANTVAPDNAGITANGTAISSLNNITVQQVWDALTSGSYASGSFGERLLTSQGTQRTVQVTGSNHVAADVHEFQNDAITAAAIAADAVTELQTGLVTVGTAFTYTNGAGDTHSVTIS